MTPKPNLDFLRAVAVLLVVADHTLLAKEVLSVRIGPLLWDPGWLGVFGVYLFFVHTSLVLMWSLERRPHTFDFYIRRVFRIYPLAVAAILVAVVTRAPVAGTAGHWFTAATLTPLKVVANLSLLQNLAPQRWGGGVIGVLWSLPLELEMYVLLPALFFLVRDELSLVPLLLLWALVVRVTMKELPPETGNIFPMVIPDFLPGVMAYVGFRRWQPKLPAWVFPGFLLVLLLFFMAAPGVRRAWPVCLALGLLLPLFRQLSARWLVRASHVVAKYSYGVYLSHPFAIALAIGGLPRVAWPVQVGLELLLTAVFSVAGYHLLESPMIHVGSRVANRWEQRHERAEAARVKVA